MKEPLKRLIILREMHSFQVIALVGLVMSAVAQLLMVALDKQVPSFGYIYPTWAAVFLLGYIPNLKSDPDDHHHH